MVHGQLVACAMEFLFLNASRCVCACSTFGQHFAAGTYSSMLTGMRVYQLKRKNGLVAVEIVMKLSGLMYSDVSTVTLTHNKVQFVWFDLHVHSGG